MHKWQEQYFDYYKKGGDYVVEPKVYGLLPISYVHVYECL
jgi:hypothetical protein